MYGGTDLNRVIVNIPDKRIERLTEMYQPRKVMYATLEIVDIPGIGVKESTRGSRLLGNIKDVELLLHVVRGFDAEGIAFAYDDINPVRDVETVDLELLAADSTTLENKLNRLVKKVRGGDKDAVREAGHCEKVRDAIQQGIPARKQGLTAAEIASVRECNLVSLKTVIYIANIKSMTDANSVHVQKLRQMAAEEEADMITISGKDEADISELEPDDRSLFLKELDITESAMERLLHAAYRKLGLVNFFTVGEDEVLAWTCRQGDKAPVAAGRIHSDMERGFIRMEVMTYADLVELGNEAAVAKAGKKRVEGREYEVQDGDIVSVLFNA
jgi:GTP-binding protein YchF